MLTEYWNSFLSGALTTELNIAAKEMRKRLSYQFLKIIFSILLNIWLIKVLFLLLKVYIIWTHDDIRTKKSRMRTSKVDQQILFY